MPPRAKNRSATQKVEHGLGRPYRRSRAALDAAQKNIEQSRTRHQNQIFNFQLSLRDWLLIFAALLPGLPQTITKRWLSAAVFTALLAVLLIGLRATFYTAFSEQIIYALLLLVAASVYDGANAVAAPAPAGKEFFRAVRLLCLSLWLVSSLYLTAMFIFNRQYLSAQIYNNAYAASPAAVIRNGDYVLVQRLDGIKNLRHGDVIMANYQCDRVLGLPGDRVQGKDGFILVNGAPVLKSRLPFLFASPAPDFDVNVGENQILLWQQILVLRANTPVLIKPYRIYEADEVQGRVVAIHAPAKRRQRVK